MPIYLHEIIRTVPGQEEPYMASVLSVVEAPSRMEPDREPVFGLWRTAETSGRWPSVVNIWQHPGWHTQFENLRRQFGDVQRDSSMEDWWQANLHLRTGGYDRILLATDYTPDGVEALKAAGIRGRVFLHEIHTMAFGAVPGFLERLGQDFVPAAAKHGWKLIGAYSVAWRPRESDAALKSWFAYRDATVQECDEMVMLPGRLNPMAEFPP